MKLKHEVDCFIVKQVTIIDVSYGMWVEGKTSFLQPLLQNFPSAMPTPPPQPL